MSTLNKCCCHDLPDQIDFMTIGSVKELNSILTAIDSDERTWATTFRCNYCGQIWLERYETHGHCEVPFVQKVPKPQPPNPSFNSDAASTS